MADNLGIPVDGQMQVLQLQLINPTKGALYALKLQLRGLELIGEKDSQDYTNLMAQQKRLASLLAFYEGKLAELASQVEAKLEPVEES